MKKSIQSRREFLHRSLAIGTTTMIAGFSPLTKAAGGDDFEQLTPEQQRHAQRMLDYMAKTESRFFNIVEGLNGQLQLEEKDFSFDAADHIVKVTRGEVIEKAGWYENISKQGQPPYVPEPIWSRYMEINIHPKTPFVGMLHATIYFSFLKNNMNALAGYMDYVPGVVVEEDNQQLKQVVEDVYEKHGADISPFRKELCESEFGAKHHRDALKAACVGTSLYAPPMLRIKDSNWVLVTEAFDAFLDTYISILEKRKDQPFTDEDLAARDAMRKRWLEDQLFADTMSKEVVPYEVWSMANLPPEVKF